MGISAGAILDIKDADFLGWAASLVVEDMV